MNCWLILGAMIATSAGAQNNTNTSNTLPPIPAPSATVAPAPSTPAPAAEPAPSAAPVKHKKHKAAAPAKAITEPTVALVPGPAEVAANINARGQAGLKGEDLDLVIFVSGEVDTTSAAGLLDFVKSIIPKAKEAGGLVIDLHDVRYISSLGVGSLANLLSETHKQTLPFTLSPAPAPVDRGLTRARLAQLHLPVFFQIAPDDFDATYAITDALYQAGDRGGSRVAESEVSGRGLAQFRDDPALAGRFLAWLDATLRPAAPPPPSPAASPNSPPSVSPPTSCWSPTAPCRPITASCSRACSPRCRRRSPRPS